MIYRIKKIPVALKALLCQHLPKTLTAVFLNQLSKLEWKMWYQKSHRKQPKLHHFSNKDMHFYHKWKMETFFCWSECSKPLPSHLKVNFVCLYIDCTGEGLETSHITRACPKLPTLWISSFSYLPPIKGQRSLPL